MSKINKTEIEFFRASLVKKRSKQTRINELTLERIIIANKLYKEKDVSINELCAITGTPSKATIHMYLFENPVIIGMKEMQENIRIQAIRKTAKQAKIVFTEKEENEANEMASLIKLGYSITLAAKNLGLSTTGGRRRVNTVLKTLNPELYEELFPIEKQPKEPASSEEIIERTRKTLEGIIYEDKTLQEIATNFDISKTVLSENLKNIRIILPDITEETIGQLESKLKKNRKNARKR